MCLLEESDPGAINATAIAANASSSRHLTGVSHRGVDSQESDRQSGLALLVANAGCATTCADMAATAAVVWITA